MATRSPEEIRRSIVKRRHDLADSVEELRVRMQVMTDWRRQVNELTERKDRLQAELSRDSAEFRATLGKATVAELQAVIGDHA